jgi:hypothetical protein
MCGTITSPAAVVVVQPVNVVLSPLVAEVIDGGALATILSPASGGKFA